MDEIPGTGVSIQQPRHARSGADARGRDVLIYVADRDGLSSIFESAHLVPASLLHSPQLITGVVALMSAATWLKPPLRRKWSAKSKEWRHAVDFLSSYPSLSKEVTSDVCDRMAINHEIGKIRRRFAPNRVIVSTGSARLVPILSRFKDAGVVNRLVYHVWGPDAEERLFARRAGGGNSNETRDIDAARAQQRSAIACADAMISISRPMTAWLEHEMGANPAAIFEVPWLTDASLFQHARAQRDRVRDKLGLSRRFVLGYSGSMLSWQLDASALREIVTACRAAGRDVAFLALTMHQSSIRRALRQSGLADADITVLSAPFSEVPNYLAAMDLGVVGRNLFHPPEIVNLLSSPVKFGEYLLSGVPVILSAALEDAARLTLLDRVGVVVEEDATAQSIALQLSALFSGDGTALEALRARCVATANAHLSYQSQMRAYALAHGVEIGGRCGLDDCVRPQPRADAGHRTPI